MAELQLNGVETPPAGVGARLTAAREALGWSRAQLAARTKIPERHLAAIESGNFAALPARTYAIGFTRTYAREVGLAEAAVVADLRTELDGLENDVPRVASFEPGDPARVPAGGLAWIAALAALAVLIAVVVVWRPFFSPAMTLPPLKADPVPSAPASLAVPTGSAAPVALGTAISDNVEATSAATMAAAAAPSPRAPATGRAPRSERAEPVPSQPARTPSLVPVAAGAAAPEMSQSGASTVSD